MLLMSSVSVCAINQDCSEDFDIFYKLFSEVGSTGIKDQSSQKSL